RGRALIWRGNSYASRWPWRCYFIITVIIYSVVGAFFEVASVKRDALFFAGRFWGLVRELFFAPLPSWRVFGGARIARKACNRKHAGEQQLLHQYLPLANIDAPPRIVPAMTLASVGGGAATIGALVQKMPMPPGLGGVSRPLVALILP